jgi:hypothetical protein
MLTFAVQAVARATRPTRAIYGLLSGWSRFRIGFMDRDELHELVMLLKDDLSSGQLKTPESSSIPASLAAVRFADDGKVITDSVNGAVRAAALAALGAKQHREMRKIPLRDTQSEYFDILDQFFGQPFSEMQKYGLTPAEVAENLSSQESIVRAFQTDLPEFVSGMNEFWDYFGPVVDLHLSDLRSLKSVFGGDIFPSYVANIACSVGLYMDTVVLPDPLLRILTLTSVTPPRESLYFLAKHALSAMRYRTLALAEVDPPIVVIAGDPLFRERSYQAALQIVADRDVVKHASAIFGRPFSGVDDLQSFLSRFSNVDQLVSKFADGNRFLFDTQWSGTPAEQFANYVAETTSKVPKAVGRSVGETTYQAFSGRMMQTNDLLLRSARYQGTPLIDAPTSWQYLLWKYEYDAENIGISEDNFQHAIISRAIASEGNSKIGMLSGLPPEVLIELRQHDAMADLRETIRTGLDAIDLASPNSLSAVTDGVIANIDRAFEQHDKQLKDLSSSRRKFFGFDVSRWVVTGGVSLAAALAKNPALGILAAATPSILGAPSAVDLRQSWQDLQAQSKNLQRSPTAILFRHLGDKFGFSD